MSIVTGGLLLGLGGTGATISPPAEPTLAMVDNEDGTGTATISGSDVGTTNTLYSFPVGGGVKTSRGSRSGDGTIDVTLTGTYYWQVKSADSDGCSAWSNIIWMKITNGESSIYEQILMKVQADIQELALSGLSSDDIIVQMVPQQVAGHAKPYLLVCGFGNERHDALGQQPTQKDDIQYPVLISFIDKGNRDQVTNLSRWLLWRQLISKHFRNQPLQLNTQQAYRVFVTYRDITDIAAWIRTNDALGGIMLNVWVRETRG